MIKKALLLTLLYSFILSISFAQDTTDVKSDKYQFTMINEVVGSDVQNQHRSGTCWSYSAMGVVESEMIRLGKDYVNLSEMFVVRYAYEQKAINYVRMHGKSHFTGGGAINDVFNIYKRYGAVPNDIYNGLNYGTDNNTHGELNEVLKQYLDGVIKNKNKTLSTAWLEGYKGILDAYLGEVPAEFEWEGKRYTPRTFADELVGIDTDNYYLFSSYTHHPFYKPFVLEVPDNWTWSSYWNLPIDEMMEVIEYSISNGHTIVWASDISEEGFSSSRGIAIVPEGVQKTSSSFKSPLPEKVITQEMRQKAFDNYQTTDDHGMILTGIAKDQNGAKYYYVKNSWGTTYNDYGGYLYASEAFVKYKTMSVAVHKDGIPKGIKKKLIGR